MPGPSIRCELRAGAYRNIHTPALLDDRLLFCQLEPVWLGRLRWRIDIFDFGNNRLVIRNVAIVLHDHLHAAKKFVFPVGKTKWVSFLPFRRQVGFGFSCRVR